MKLVYTHENSALVGLAKSMLENAGMKVILKNEFTSTLMYPTGIQQELWLPDESDYDTAVEILESLAEEE
jgi:hypothetical protein